MTVVTWHATLAFITIRPIAHGYAHFHPASLTACVGMFIGPGWKFGIAGWMALTFCALSVVSKLRDINCGLRIFNIRVRERFRWVS